MTASGALEEARRRWGPTGWAGRLPGRLRAVGYWRGGSLVIWGSACSWPRAFQDADVREKAPHYHKVIEGEFARAAQPVA